MTAGVATSVHENPFRELARSQQVHWSGGRGGGRAALAAALEEARVTGREVALAGAAQEAAADLAGVHPSQVLAVRYEAQQDARERPHLEPFQRRLLSAALQYDGPTVRPDALAVRPPERLAPHEREVLVNALEALEQAERDGAEVRVSIERNHEGEWRTVAARIGAVRRTVVSGEVTLGDRDVGEQTVTIDEVPASGFWFDVTFDQLRGLGRLTADSLRRWIDDRLTRATVEEHNRRMRELAEERRSVTGALIDRRRALEVEIMGLRGGYAALAQGAPPPPRDGHRLFQAVRDQEALEAEITEIRRVIAEERLVTARRQEAAHPAADRRRPRGRITRAAVEAEILRMERELARRVSQEIERQAMQVAATFAGAGVAAADTATALRELAVALDLHPELDNGSRFSDAANARARDLLERHLSPAQLESFRALGTFDVRAASGHRYRIEQGRTVNVTRDDGASFCAVARGVPLCDHLLAQKMMLEADEEAFLAVAVRWGGPAERPDDADELAEALRWRPYRMHRFLPSS